MIWIKNIVYTFPTDKKPSIFTEGKAVEREGMWSRALTYLTCVVDHVGLLDSSDCFVRLRKNLICRKCEELVSGEWIQAKKSNYATQLSIQWRVVFWSNCRHRVNRLLSSGKNLQLKLILVESGVDCLYDFYVSWHLSYFCCFLFGHSTFLSLHLCQFRMGTSCCVLRSIKFWVELSRLIVLWQMFWISRTMAYLIQHAKQ